jgi:hypothetical protein
MSEEKTKVVFRKWSNGDIIAMFPEIPYGMLRRYCVSYEHVGQHGATSPDTLTLLTTKPRPEEYAELKAELERIGYILEVRSRITSQMHAKRRASA